MSAQVIEAKLEAESRAFQKLQKGIVLLFGNGQFISKSATMPWFTPDMMELAQSVDLTKAVESRQQLDSQRQENELVKKVCRK